MFFPVLVADLYQRFVIWYFLKLNLLGFGLALESIAIVCGFQGESAEMPDENKKRKISPDPDSSLRLGHNKVCFYVSLL